MDDERTIRSDERKRIAAGLRRYFEEGPATYRVLLEYIDVDYATGMDEGWLEFNNAVAAHDEKVATGERTA
jgi:hypothetical protein